MAYRLAGSIFLVCMTLAACNPKPPDEGSYIERLTAARAAKDAQFRRESTPVPEARKDKLLPLDYYPIDPQYNVPAVLTPSNDPTVILMPTTAGKQDRYRRAGRLDFTLHGEPMTLTAFVAADNTDMSLLWVPFRDPTAGTETYDAGRYLELPRTASGYYELDFNRAFNPYCYYSLEYECPLPPPENRLKTPIRAGEKTRK